MFFNEEAFKNEPKWEVEVEHNDLKEHSYFIEAVDEMLHCRLMHEGYFQDMLNAINDIYKANSHYITDSLFTLCRENQKITRDMTRTFIGDFSSIVREKSRWYKEHEKIIRSYNGKSITPINVVYNYKHLDDSHIPNIAYMRDMQRDIVTTRNNLKSVGSSAEKRLVIDVERERIYDNIHTEQYYAKVRGSMFETDLNINKPKKISVDDYGSFIYDFFREYRDQKFTANEIRGISTRFSLYSRYVTTVRNMMSDMDHTYDAINSAVHDMEKYSKEIMYDERLLDSFNKYMVTLQDQVYHVSGIVIMAFAGKLDAISKSYLQDYEVLKQVVDSIKTGGEIK